VKVWTSDRAAWVVITDRLRVAHCERTSAIIFVEDWLPDVGWLERDRRSTSAHVHRDEDSLGSAK
jgi:hypothetical protein